MVYSLMWYVQFLSVFGYSTSNQPGYKSAFEFEGIRGFPSLFPLFSPRIHMLMVPYYLICAVYVSRCLDIHLV